MKKIITSLVIVTLMVVFNITSIYAANLNATLTVQEVAPGKTFRISVNSSSKLTDFEASVNNSSLGTPTVVAKYNGSSESTKGTQKIVKMFQLAAQAEKTAIASGANLATFEYTVPANLAPGSYNIAVTLKAVTVSGDMLNESVTKTIKVVAAKSTNANLSSITVDGKALTGFNKNTTSYTLDSVENNVTSITVGATVEDSKANVSGTGKINLNEGKNTITLKVTAESGATKTYTLIVTRKAKEVEPEPEKSTNANLSSITIDGKALAGFNKNTTTYTLATVESNVTSLTVGAKAEDAKAKVSGAGKISLKEGKNTIKVKVTAESGATKTYTLTVTRKELPKSTNANLSSITIDGKALAGFNKNTTSYTLATVENNVASITVGAKAEESKAKVSGAGKISLKEGKNTITLKVTAESGATKTYTLTVTRKAKEVKPEVVISSDNSLKTLKVNGKDVAITNNKFEYELDEVSYEVTKITIAATTNHEKAVVEGTGNKELKVGKNKFTLTVTAEDGTEQTYSVNIVRKAQEVTKPVVDEKDSNSSNITYIVIAITSVLILAVIIMFVISRRKK